MNKRKEAFYEINRRVKNISFMSVKFNEIKFKKSNVLLYKARVKTENGKVIFVTGGIF